MCEHCVSDCSTTSYETSISSAPFRRCDLSSYGMSQFCNLNDPNAPRPTIYGDQVIW